MRVQMSRARSVGRQPEMMPTEGSTLDQMKTSLLAQLISWVLVRSTITLIRMMDAMQTLRHGIISSSQSHGTRSCMYVGNMIPKSQLLTSHQGGK